MAQEAFNKIVCQVNNLVAKVVDLVNNLLIQTG